MTHSAAHEKTVAFVLYPGLTVFDLVGPLQVFRTLETLDPRFRAVVVAERVEEVTTDSGLTLLPEHSFADLPHPDILIVPGGGVPTLRAMSNSALRRYVRSAAQSAEVVGSVCTGALILASVGLLKGRQATTHWAFYKVLENFGVPYRRERWVETGNIICSAGVSAGIDMALHLVARLTDEATARRVQLWMDYDPLPPFGRIDWERLVPNYRRLRAFISLVAPVITLPPKVLTRLGR